MLRSTFQHIRGFGQKSEKRLWGMGCTTWDRVLDRDFGLPGETHRRLKAGVLESMGRLDALDHGYFRETLGGRLAWRAYGAFRDHACFLDIETTGLSPKTSKVTTVCVHSRKKTKSYILGRNLEELKGDLEGYKYLVTFNGARFDLPFLSQALGLEFGQLHLDLVYPLRRLGYSGGLKSIECQLGVERSTEGVDGFDAVRLWHAYRSGKAVDVAGRRVGGEDALELLVRYNEEDTVNLQGITEHVIGELGKLMPAGVHQ